jgi:hypothetical protein
MSWRRRWRCGGTLSRSEMSAWPNGARTARRRWSTCLESTEREGGRFPQADSLGGKAFGGREMPTGGRCSAEMLQLRAESGVVRRSRIHQPIYRPIQPPSTVSISPLTYMLALLARYTTLPLKSSGDPQRPAGIRSRILFARLGSLIKAVFISVAI